MKRREFVRDATGVAAWTALSASRVLGANDRVVVGLLGCGARGPAVMRGMLEAPGAELAAICDVYDTNAARANTTLVNGRAKTMKDFRRVLEMKEVDAIYVATPDFWHSIHTVMSLEAGKHVFVEKPFALTIREGRVMVEAAARTKKILMPATQHRSAPHIIEAAAMVASGEIGQVAFVRAWNSRNVDGMWTKVPDSDPPAGLDWDMFLGPSSKVPFNAGRFLVNWRNFRDCAGGPITDFGNHRIDSVYQIMGTTQMPHTISAVGRRIFTENDGDQFDLHVVQYQFPNFVLEYTADYQNAFGLGGGRTGMKYYQMTGQYDRPHGFAFYGSKAALYVDRIGWELFPETGRRGGASGERKFRQGDDATSLHAQSFIKQVRIGTKGEVDDMSGFRSTSTCHLGTIAARVNHTIEWNERTDEIPNDPAASRLLTRTFRKPYDLIKL